MAENPRIATSTKCFSGIFQRLICGGSLPTHPSDEFKEPNRTTTFDHSSSHKLPLKITEANISNKVAANSPGIVARLMGLDTLPEEEEKKTSFGSFSRSRSVNSLDYLMKFNLTEQLHHRRVRTSVSFREIPNFDQDFKSEFLVFCFNDKEEKQEIRKSNQEMKPKKVADSNNKNVQKKVQKNDKKQVCVKQNRIGNKVKKQVKFEDYPTKMSAESKKKRKGKCAQTQPLFNSADSSSIQHGATPAGNKGKMQLNSRKSPTRIIDPEHAITSKVEKQKEISLETNYYIKVLGETCRLTEEELNESHWIATRVGENFKFEELCLEFGHEVLELLIDQVVHELLMFGQ